MTECIDRSGQEELGKTIEFLWIIDRIHKVREPNSFPTRFSVIELITRNYGNDRLDLMYAYDEGEKNTKEACLYLGHWNSGKV